VRQLVQKSFFFRFFHYIFTETTVFRIHMNKKLLSFLFVAATLTASFFGCKKADEEPPVQPDYQSYLPLQKDKYIIYNVDSTIWENELCVTVQRKYQIMYTVSDTFTDGQGRSSYRIDTRIRKNMEEPWEVQDVVYITSTKANTEFSQKGNTYIKLIYPIDENRTWKGNALVDVGDSSLSFYDNWDYRYVNIDQPFNTGEVVYNNTITVIQRDETINNPETLPDVDASRTYGKEVYANNIGMVYREFIRWTYDSKAWYNNDPNNPNKCRKGYGVVMRAVDHN
jgi:hypothetical protein